MKIFFTHKPITSSYGGGNQFVLNMIDYLKKKIYFPLIYLNLKINNIDIIFIIEPQFKQKTKKSIHNIINYKKIHPNVKVIHRVNECDIKREVSINIEPLLVNTMKFADYVVFVSKWLEDYFITKYKLNINSKAILNGCNLQHFTSNSNTKFQNNKIRLVTHHFSSNYLKGFHIYNELDKVLEDRKDIEFTYIGNYNNNYSPRNIKILPTTNGKKVGGIKKKKGKKINCNTK